MKLINKRKQSPNIKMRLVLSAAACVLTCGAQNALADPDYWQLNMPDGVYFQSDLTEEGVPTVTMNAEATVTGRLCADANCSDGLVLNPAETISTDSDGTNSWPSDGYTYLDCSYTQTSGSTNIYDCSYKKSIPIISNEDSAGNTWDSGMGNVDTEVTSGDDFWSQDYGIDEENLTINGKPFSRWTIRDGALYQSTECIDNYGTNCGSRAFPVTISTDTPYLTNAAKLHGAAKTGLWQVDIHVGSDGSNGSENGGSDKYCETFYLAERNEMSPGSEYYSDGSEAGGDAGHSREIDIMETRWNGGGTQWGPQYNLPNGSDTGWNTGAGVADTGIVKKTWDQLGGDSGSGDPVNGGGIPMTSDTFITFGAMIKKGNDNGDDDGTYLWIYAMQDGKVTYSSDPIPEKNDSYTQAGDFVPYIGTWTDDGNTESGGFETGYKNYMYIAEDNIPSNCDPTNPNFTVANGQATCS